MPPLDRGVTPHHRSQACGMAHCHVHNLDEHIGVAYFIICFECNHVYKTADELLDTFNAIGRQSYQECVANEWRGWGDCLPFEDVVDPNAIHFCPLCQHDF